MVLARGGDCTSVACLSSIGPFGDAVRKRGIRVDLIGKRNGFPGTVWRMSTYLQKIRPDVLHCHNFAGLPHAALAARLTGGIPVVMTKHGTPVPRAGIGGWLNRRLVRQTRVVAVSSEVLAIMKEWVPSGSHPVRMIANGLCTATYENLPSRLEARSQLGLPAGSFIVGIVARLTGLKGHDLLINVFARIVSKMPGAVLLIVGDGGGRPALRSQIQKLGLERQVLLMGARNDVPAILAAMDVFCLPSESEGMPMTVLEAMAAGLPVVASNVGGIPEIVQEGRTGLMVPPGASEELEAALLCLANAPTLAREMGREGRERLVRKFSLKQAIDSYEGLYKQVVCSKDV
jgi:glycosyltransferase involved in cell wall biosynthesis